MNRAVRKPECQSFCPWPISPALQWGRRTPFPPSAWREKHSSCFGGALHMDWTLPCLSFPLLFSTEWIHPSWRWSFPLAFVLIAFFKYLVQACLYSTLTEVGYFLPGAPVAGDGGEPGRRPGSGKGPWEAGRALGRSVCQKEEEKSAKVEGDHKGNKGNGQTGRLGLRWVGEGAWLGVVLYGAFRRRIRQPVWRQRKVRGKRQLAQNKKEVRTNIQGWEWVTRINNNYRANCWDTFTSTSAPDDGSHLPSVRQELPGKNHSFWELYLKVNILAFCFLLIPQTIFYSFCFLVDPLGSWKDAVAGTTAHQCFMILFIKIFTFKKHKLKHFAISYTDQLILVTVPT